MGWKGYEIFPLTMTTGATLTSAVDLGRPWNFVYLHTPATASGANYWIKGAPTLAGTYNRITQPPYNTTVVQTNSFVINSNQTSTVIPIPNGLRFMKIEASTGLSDTSATFYITGSE